MNIGLGGHFEVFREGLEARCHKRWRREARITIHSNLKLEAFHNTRINQNYSYLRNQRKWKAWG